MARQKYGGMLLGQMDDQIASYGMDPSREVSGAAANDWLRVRLPGWGGRKGEAVGEGGGHPGRREKGGGTQADPGAHSGSSFGATHAAMQPQRTNVSLVPHFPSPPCDLPPLIPPPSTRTQALTDKEYAASMLELEQRRGAMLSGLPAERREAAVFLRDALLTHLELAKRGAKDAGGGALLPPGGKAAEQPLGGTAGERGPSFGKTVSAAAAAPPAVRQQSGVAAPPPPARQQSASAAAPWQEARLEPLPTEERDSAVGRWAEAGSGGGAGGSKKAEEGGSGGGSSGGGGGGGGGDTLLSRRSSATTAPAGTSRGSSYDGGRASIAGGGSAYSGYSAQQSAPQSPRALQKQQSGGAPPPIGVGATSPRSGAGIAPPGGSSSPLNQSIGRYSGLPANSAAAAARGSGADGYAGAGPGLNASLQRSARSSVNAGGGLITPLSPLDQSLKRQAASSGALNQSLGRRITDGTVAAAAASGGSLNQSIGRVGPARPPSLVAPQGSGLAAPMNMSLRSAGECGLRAGGEGAAWCEWLTRRVGDIRRARAA